MNSICVKQGCKADDWVQLPDGTFILRCVRCGRTLCTRTDPKEEE